VYRELLFICQHIKFYLLYDFMNTFLLAVILLLPLVKLQDLFISSKQTNLSLHQMH